MRRLIQYAVHQPLFIVLGTLLFVLAGVIAFKNLSVEAFPDVTDTQVTVIALFPGRAAEEVEKQVTLPIEMATRCAIPKRICAGQRRKRMRRTRDATGIWRSVSAMGLHR